MVSTLWCGLAAFVVACARGSDRQSAVDTTRASASSADAKSTAGAASPSASTDSLASHRATILFAGTSLTAGLGLGLHRELVPELKELASTYPLHEWFQGGLIIALQRCGRRSEALQVYQRLRHLLRDELGLDPSPGLQQIRQHVLTDRVTAADLSLLVG